MQLIMFPFFYNFQLLHTVTQGFEIHWWGDGGALWILKCSNHDLYCFVAVCGLGYLASLGNFENFCNLWVSNGTNKRCCVVAGVRTCDNPDKARCRLSLELAKCVFCPWSQVVVQARYKDPVSGYIYRLISVALWDCVVRVGAAWMSVAGRLNGSRRTQKIRATRCTGCGAEAEAQVIPTSSRRRPASANLARSTSTQRLRYTVYK